jgi:hypothetical protein
LNPQDELLDTIDNYLNRVMSEEERFAFEERLALDETLSAKVNEVRLTNEAIYYASLAELKNTIGKDIKNIKYKPSFNWKKASYISIASLVLLSGITTYVFVNNTDNKPVKQDRVKNKQRAIQGNNGSVTSEKAVDAKKSYQQQPLTIPGKIDSTQKDVPSKQNLILPADNNVQQVEKIKPADSGNTLQKNDSDQGIKNIVPPETDTKIACDKLFKINTEASCKQKETGSIHIISDGAYSYTYQVDIQSTSGSKGTFTNMPSGVHEILVTYGKECIYKKKVSIAEKWCAMNESYSFNPDYNEKWILNYETGASGTFTIFDKSGKDIYSNTFGSGNEEWNGTSNQGTTVPVGIYIAFINYSDGRKEKVELTIVR